MFLILILHNFGERWVHSSFSLLPVMFLDSSLSNASGADSLAIQPQKLLILDARSYAAAVANRAKGGGCECPGEVYGTLSPDTVLMNPAHARLGLSSQFEMNGKLCSSAYLERARAVWILNTCFFSGKWRRRCRETK